jgi:hypothetical protein
MPRTLFAVPLTLALLASLAPGSAVAGPPEGVSGKLVLDKAGAGLDRYHKETDPARRAEWLTALAPTRDPRVAVALGEALESSNKRIISAAVYALAYHYDTCVLYPREETPDAAALRWWKANKADLYRRAKELPR